MSQAKDVLELSATLSDEQKVIVAYWAAGPNNELPPGHWDLFAQFVSRRDGHARDAKGTEADVKMFFALANADASIAGWGNKRNFDSVRPITAIRSLFRGQKVSAWGGPGKGTQEIDGEDWVPYHPATFPTPPFPEYVSGHSIFGAAGAEIMKRFTGSDDFGNSVTIKAGSSGYEPGVPAADVTLTWKTSRTRRISGASPAATGGSTSSPLTSTAGTWAERWPGWRGRRRSRTSTGPRRRPRPASREELAAAGIGQRL